MQRVPSSLGANTQPPGLPQGRPCSRPFVDTVTEHYPEAHCAGSGRPGGKGAREPVSAKSREASGVQWGTHLRHQVPLSGSPGSHMVGATWGPDGLLNWDRVLEKVPAQAGLRVGPREAPAWLSQWQPLRGPCWRFRFWCSRVGPGRLRFPHTMAVRAPQESGRWSPPSLPAPGSCRSHARLSQQGTGPR